MNINHELSVSVRCTLDEASAVLHFLDVLRTSPEHVWFQVGRPSALDEWVCSVLHDVDDDLFKLLKSLFDGHGRFSGFPLGERE